MQAEPLLFSKMTPTPNPSPQGGGGLGGTVGVSPSPLWGGVRGGGNICHGARPEA